MLMRPIARDDDGAATIDFAFSLVIVMVPLLFVLSQSVFAMLVYTDSIRTASKVAEEARRGNYAYATIEEIIADFCARRLFSSPNCATEMVLSTDSFPNVVALISDVAAGPARSDPAARAFDPSARYVRMTFTFTKTWMKWAPLDLVAPFRSWSVSEIVAVDAL